MGKVTRRLGGLRALAKDIPRQRLSYVGESAADNSDVRHGWLAEIQSLAKKKKKPSEASLEPMLWVVS